MTDNVKNEGTAPIQGFASTDGATEAAELANVKAELSNLKGRKAPDLGALIDERLAAALAPLMERMAPPKEAPQIADPVVASELAAVRKELAIERKRAAEDKRRAHEATMHASVRGKLADRVRPELLDVATEWLCHARQAVKVDERGSVRATWDGAEYESVDDMLNAFVGSKAAAGFLPPPKPVAGAQRPAMQAPARSNSTSIKDSVADRLAALRAGGYDV